MKDNLRGSLARDPVAKKDLLRRLRTASGHLGAVVRMVDDEAYCIDILKQIAAIRSALAKVAQAVSAAHMKNCVREAILADGGEERIDEMMETLRYMKHF